MSSIKDTFVRQGICLLLRHNSRLKNSPLQRHPLDHGIHLSIKPCQKIIPCNHGELWVAFCIELLRQPSELQMILLEVVLRLNIGIQFKDIGCLVKLQPIVVSHIDWFVLQKDATGFGLLVNYQVALLYVPNVLLGISGNSLLEQETTLTMVLMRVFCQNKKQLHLYAEKRPKDGWNPEI
ncbi:hypothetical protein GOP47_0004549 [Adiantum capillus-veneris]|uniref:Uncharacterized protein n=1 Tax=Adiantum capillus-veneris TaxID=13818 RepID=A0A9D4V8W3_ADICA|nr:hypothetical protein GOP47_0004549 [Adiantum capillus-veneris]